MSIDYDRIVDEATAAGLQIEHVGDGYVQATAGNWRLTCWGGLWSAAPILGNGMPLAHAIHLHEMPMPGSAWGMRHAIAGQVIRVEGHAGRPHPKAYADACNSKTGTVTRYHIDTVGGLRVFADYVRRPGLTEAVIQSPCRHSGRGPRG